MEFILIIVVVIGLFLWFKRGSEFGEQLDIVRKDVIYITGRDVELHMNWLICETIRQFPEISSYDKASIVCMSLRDTAKRNKSFNFLAHIDANYKELHADAVKEITELIVSGNCIH